MKNKDLSPADDEKQRIMLEVRKAIENIDYGEIVITMHESKVVQIEQRLKKRFK
jgi:hypothetical protein